VDGESVERLARSGRAGVLLAWAALAEGRPSDLIRPRLEEVVRQAAVLDTGQSLALGKALLALDASSIPALVMKGAALSHTCYPAAHLRPRNDDDVLVPKVLFENALRALRACGYEADAQIEAPLLTGQRHVVRRWPWGLHHIDLHWRPLNPVAFDDLPPFDALAAASVPLPVLGSSARGLGPVHALLLLCAHRVAHHGATEDPQWLLDVHLMAGLITQDDWPAFASLAERCRLAEVCLSELGRTSAILGTDIPAGVLTQLSRAAGEPSAAHLRELGPLHVQWLNLRQLPDMGTRLSLLRAHAFPSRAYMQSRFGTRGIALPWMYLRRLIGGLGRWGREFTRRRRHEGRQRSADPDSGRDSAKS